MNLETMNVVNLCVNAVNCTIILILIILTLQKLENSIIRRYFLVLLLTVFMFNAMDCIAWAFEGLGAPWKIPAYHISNFLYFLMVPFMYLAFMKFLRTVMKEKTVHNRFYIVSLIPCFLDLMAAFASCYPGFLYTISPENSYQRSPYHILHVICIFTFYFFVALYMFSNRDQMDNKTFLTMLSFPTLPTLCYIPQLLFYGIASVNVGLVVSLVLMYLNLRRNIQLGTVRKLVFSSEYFQKKDTMTHVEKLRRFICSYGFSDNAINSIRNELRANVSYSLKIITSASGILMLLCFILSFFVDYFAGERMLYLATTVLCLLLTLVFQSTVHHRSFSVTLGYLFFIMMFAANIYQCMAITPDEAPLLFVCVLCLAPSVFCDKPYLICLLDYAAVFIYMDLARIYKDPEIAANESVYLFVLATLGIVIGYGLSKTKITSIYLTKNLDNEVAAKTQQLNAMSKEIVSTLASSIESKDKYTNGHSERVANYAVMLASRIGWNEDKCDELWMEAILHDVGKIGIPDSILNKTGKLTEEEFRIIQSHTTLGARILENLATFPKAREAANFHHERINGKGYPEGLLGDDIPEAAKIVAIADAYDAMTTSRCYRPALKAETVMKELEQGRGTQFDAELLDAFIELLNEHDGSLIQDAAEN